MKKSYIVISIVAVAVAGVFAAAWLSPDKQNSEVLGEVATAQEQKFATIQAELAAAAKLYDVRTAEEFSDGHFAGAVNFTLQDLQQGKLPELDKDTKIYVYCRSGNRSAQATQILREAGFTNIEDLGGLADIEKMGGKLVAN